MTTLYIDRKNLEVAYDSGALVFYDQVDGKRERMQTIPVAPIDRVVILGDILVHANVLGQLGKAGIGVTVLSGRTHEPTLLMPCPHNDASKRLAQFRMSMEPHFALLFSRKVVTSKIQAQEEFIGELLEDNPGHRFELFNAKNQIHDLLDRVADAENVESLRGLEGRAAAVYFKGLEAIMAPSLNFHGRNRRPPRDPLNAVLSLGYTLLHAEAVQALYSAGLDPYVGFFHNLDFARESFACDIIERQRVTIDKFAIQCFKKQVLRVEDFSITDNGCMMGKAGRIRFYEEYEPLGLSLRQHFQKLGQTLGKVFQKEATLLLSVPVSEVKGAQNVEAHA